MMQQGGDETCDCHDICTLAQKLFNSETKKLFHSVSLSQECWTGLTLEIFNTLKVLKIILNPWKHVVTSKSLEHFERLKKW